MPISAARACLEFSYRSRPLVSLTDADFRSIAGKTFRTNNRLGITGFLEFDGTIFCQRMTGPAPAVARLAARIIADCRHESLELVTCGPAAPRHEDVFSVIGFAGHFFGAPRA